jgi:hypothetical protein
MASLNGVRTIFSYIPILQQVASPLFLFLKQCISLPLYLLQLLLIRTSQLFISRLNLLKKHGLLIVKAVVQPNCGFIPIKILNISDQEHVLQKNTIAAQLEPR